MTVYPQPADGIVYLMARAESAGIVGDARWEVRPGQSLFGLTYDQWRAARGPVEIPADRERPGGVLY